MIAQYGLGFGAGVLSLLAPCVLPLIPIIFGSSMQSSKFAPVANAFGLTFAFTLVGILSSLFSSLFDVDMIQKIGAIILIAVGIVFIIPHLKDKLASQFSSISNKGHLLQNNITNNGLFAQFLFGGLLGMIWGPCSGPTLALAFGVATQTDMFIEASLIFFFFGLGAGTGLVILGLSLRKFSKLTGKLMKYNHIINKMTGIASITIGVIIINDQLGAVETILLDLLPTWLVNLSVAL